MTPRVGNRTVILSAGHYPLLLQPASFPIAASVVVLLGLSLGAFLLIKGWDKDAAALKGVFLAANGSILFSFLATVFLNPGIADPHPDAEEHEQQLSKQDRKNSVFCRVCSSHVLGFDHHCSFLEVCIGRNNIWAFFLLLCSGLGWFLGTFLLAVQHMATMEDTR